MIFFDFPREYDSLKSKHPSQFTQISKHENLRLKFIRRMNLQDLLTFGLLEFPKKKILRLNEKRNNRDT